MAGVLATTPLRESGSRWVNTPGWDLFWMFSAVWAMALCATAASAVGVVTVAAWVIGVSGLLSICHSFSTTYMVVASPLMRDARKRNRMKYTWIPLAILVGSIALGWAVGATASFPHSFPLTSEQGLWSLYLALFWVGHFWHFGNQDFGVLSIYRLKAGQAGALDRRIDKAFAVAMMFVIQPFVYLKSVATSPWSETVYSFLPLSREFVLGAATLGVGVAVVLTVAVIGFELRKADTSWPKILYYGVMLSHPLVLYFIHWGLAPFYLVAYFWSHWLVAIGLVGRINTNYYKEGGASPWRAIGTHLRTFGLFALAGGAYHVYFNNYALFSGRQYKETLSAVWPEWQWLVGLILGGFLAEQLVHYYCDRCLFRFRDPEVRRAVAPRL